MPYPGYELFLNVQRRSDCRQEIYQWARSICNPIQLQYLLPVDVYIRGGFQIRK